METTSTGKSRRNPAGQTGDYIYFKPLGGTTIGLVSSIAKNYGKGDLPPKETRLNDYISYRYAEFYDNKLTNPWDPNDVIDPEEGREGTKTPWGWVRKIEEKQEVVSREDLDKKAKIGDVVYLDFGHGYVQAEILDYNKKEEELVVQIIAGAYKGLIIDAKPENLVPLPLRDRRIF
mgnify:CR=1 FL=1